MLNPDKSINQKSFISYDEFLSTFYTKKVLDISFVDTIPAPEELDVIKDGKRIKQRRIGITTDEKYVEEFLRDFSEDIRVGDKMEVYIPKKVVFLGTEIQKVKEDVREQRFRR